MGYRDELQAARLRIAKLQDELQELRSDLEADAIVKTLSERAASLAVELEKLRQSMEPRRPKLLCFGPAAAVAAAWLIAFIAVTGPTERGAWELSNTALVVGIVGTGWSWGRMGRLVGWCTSLATKVVVLLIWAHGWWAPSKADIVQVDSTFGLFDADFYFFWGAPAFILGVVLVEGAWLYHQHSATQKSAAWSELLKS